MSHRRAGRELPARACFGAGRRARRRATAAAAGLFTFTVGCGMNTTESAYPAEGTAAQPVLLGTDGNSMDCGGGSADRAPEAPAMEAKIIDLTNEVRAAAGLPALQAQGCLSWIAYEHSEDVRAGRVLPHDPHTNIDGEGPFERLQKKGIAVTAWRENIYYDCRNQNGAPSFEPDLFPQRAIDWWMSSPGHRANILATDVGHVGAGVAKGVQGINGCYWVTELFLGQ